MFWVFSHRFFFFFFVFTVLNGHGGSEVLIKRARHVITEIKRTYDAAEALNRRDFEQVHTEKKKHFQIKFFIFTQFMERTVYVSLCVAYGGNMKDGLCSV